MRIEVLGPLAVEVDGTAVILPPSKKTRALLAYLALTRRPHSRDRLCELFWGETDDPRAALRWSLSKLRALVNNEGREILLADRMQCDLNHDLISVDVFEMQGRLANGAADIALDRLLQMAAHIGRIMLDGLDLPNQQEFQAWLTAQREMVDGLRREIFKRLATHPESGKPEQLKWATRWRDADPLDETAAAHLISTYRALGRLADAAQVIAQIEDLARQAGVTLKTYFSDSVSEPLDSLSSAKTPTPKQTIGFCTTDDNVRIAYAKVGSGPPLVKAANWLNHLDLDWDSPIWGDTFRRCAARRTFIRYDERGNGLSDWDVDEISQEKFVEDLETVVDHLGLERFPLLGISQGCAVSIEYAIRHPERVSGLILISGYASGWRIGATPEEQEKREAVMTLTKHGWGTNNPAYRQIFAQTFMPDAHPDDLEWFNEFQRQTTSAENAVRFQHAFGDIDVRHLLPQIRVPTIVFHANQDQRITLDQGRELAAGIPGARFVPLESKNHIILGHETAWHECFDQMDRFLAENDI